MEFKTVKVKLKDGMTVVRMDNPPVNQMSTDFMNELNLAMREALAEAGGQGDRADRHGQKLRGRRRCHPDAAGTGQGARFVERLMWVHDLFNAIEQGPKPVIAAINGNCLGGAWRWPWPATTAWSSRASMWVCPR